MNLCLFYARRSCASYPSSGVQTYPRPCEFTHALRGYLRQRVCKIIRRPHAHDSGGLGAGTGGGPVGALRVTVTKQALDGKAGVKYALARTGGTYRGRKGAQRWALSCRAGGVCGGDYCATQIGYKRGAGERWRDDISEHVKLRMIGFSQEYPVRLVVVRLTNGPRGRPQTDDVRTKCIGSEVIIAIVCISRGCSRQHSNWWPHRWTAPSRCRQRR